MRIVKLILALSIFTLLYCSCQTDYDFKVDSDPQVIVNCLFHPDSTWKIEILQSPTSLWEYDFKPLENATVQLISNSSTYELELMNLNGSIYYTSRTNKVPQDYNGPIKLEISSDDTFVSAISNIPPKPKFYWNLDDYSFKKFTSNSNRERFTYAVSGKMRLKIDTHDNGHLWYRLSIRYRPNMLHGSTGRIQGNTRDTVIIDNLNLKIDHPDAFKTIRITDGYLIDLSTSNSETDELFLDIQGGVTNIPGDITFFTIIVTSVTEDFMKYSRKVMDQYMASQDIFSEPVSIPGNIIGGLGIFSGINSVTDTVFVDDRFPHNN